MSISARKHRRAQTHPGLARLAVQTVLAVVAATLTSVAVAPPATAATTFSNTTAITINDPPVLGSIAAATPYPSSITVSGLTGAISDLNVSLKNVTHTFSGDIDVLLEGPAGQQYVLVSDVGTNGVSNVTAVFDDQAASSLGDPWGAAGSTVTVKPTNVTGSTGDTWPGGPFGSPANADGSPATLGTIFNGLSGAALNGTWSLFVVDDALGDSGTIAGGWSLDITTVNAAATTTTLNSSLNPSRTGNSVTFSAHVTATSGGSNVTAGTATFTEGASTLAANVALNASGVATFSTSALPEGSHVITATYNGTADFATSNASVTQVVDNNTVVTGNQFCNTGAITVSAGSPAAGSPYPSHVFVSSLSGAISHLTLDLKGVTHPITEDLDVMLVGPAGQRLVVLSDAGGAHPATSANVTLDDAAGSLVGTSGGLVTGSFQPTDYGSGDVFPAPAPSSPNEAAPAGSATFASVFGGTNPNGTWALYVVDDALGDGGSLASGWCLTFTTSNDAATTTTLTSNHNPSTTSQVVTFSAHVVTNANAADVTTGTVTFREGATTLASNVALSASGVAAFSTSALAEGSHVITADYSGDPGNFNLSTGNLTQQVDSPTVHTGGTWCNDGGIDVQSATAIDAASPYPSHLSIGGAGTPSHVTVTLKGLTHTAPDDVDVLLVGPAGDKIVLLSDVGGSASLSNVNVTLDDAAASQLPDASTFATGSYQPTDVGAGDSFPAPAPSGPGEAAPAGVATLDGTFAGSSANGTWSLYVVDDTLGDSGSLTGWCVNLTLPPTADNDSYDAGKDRTLTVTAPGVLGNDSGNPAPSAVAISAGATTQGGTVTLATNGSFTYDPPAGFTGTDTFTYTATNGPGSTDTATVTITVSNAPTIIGETISRQQGSPAANSKIATVSDVESPDGNLVVTTGTLPAGITVANITNTNGNVTADVAAGCAAATGPNTVPLTVADEDGLTSDGSLIVNVSANTAPTLTYGPATYTTGAGSSADPATGPSDNGSVDAIVVQGVTPSDPGVTVDGPADAHPGRAHLPDTSPGSYTVTIRATDNCGDHTDAQLSVTVTPANQPPTADAGGPYTVAEGNGLGLDASASSDPDGDSLTYSWDVNGDGTFGDATGQKPTLTWSDLESLGINDGRAGVSYTVKVRVDDGNNPAVTSAGATLSVTNTPPTATGPATADATRNVPFTLSLGVTDPASGDSSIGFTWDVNWGDGTLPTSGVSLSSFSPSHTFATVGTFTVTAQAADKDLGHSNTVTTIVTVSGTQVVSNPCGAGNALVVSGTSAGENITVKMGRNGGLDVKVGNGATQSFPSVARLIVYAQGGNDNVTVDSKLTLPRAIYGGDGNDSITGGNGSGLQIGGPGNDSLTGGNGRDILVGGAGGDTLKGDNGDDLLVAGPTSYDAPSTSDQQAWCAIEAEWQGGSAYAARVGHIRGTLAGGLNGSTLLNATHVSDDSSQDRLTGANGSDWFLLNTTGGTITDTSDRTGTEIATDLT